MRGTRQGEVDLKLLAPDVDEVEAVARDGTEGPRLRTSVEVIEVSEAIVVIEGIEVVLPFSSL